MAEHGEAAADDALGEAGDRVGDDGPVGAGVGARAAEAGLIDPHQSHALAQRRREPAEIAVGAGQAGSRAGLAATLVDEAELEARLDPRWPAGRSSAPADRTARQDACARAA
ncbi:MAG: hypothetical protein U0168_21105 [Nannocystaceae bacterium]